MTLVKLGEDAEGEEMLVSGLELLIAARGPQDEKTVEARQRLESYHASKAVQVSL